MKWIKVLFFALFLFFSLFFSFSLVRADEASENLAEQERLEKLISDTQKKAGSLKNEIAIMDSQVQLANLKIQQTLSSIDFLEKQIKELSIKISDLDLSLTNLSIVFLNRVSQSYKSQTVSPFSLFLSADSFGDFYRKLKYLKALQLNDRAVMIKLEEARLSFDRQKQEREEKQSELESLKKTLDSQKKSLEDQKAQKNYLLQMTKNDEQRYQQLLSRVRAEYEAIQAVLAGSGNEIGVGEVGKGEVIASIINGSSCNSSGPHLHFSVTQGDGVVNPFNYLRGGVSFENCSGLSCGDASGDSFNPSGSWDWPIDEPITFSQGYGSTWAVANTWVRKIYNFHNGIDIHNSSLNVKAVADGKLYRGSYTGSGGCGLRYVRLVHKDSDLESYYLHINYTKI